MSLRQARIEDHWRRAFSRKYPTRFEEITFRDLSCFADSTVRFSPGITVIVGGNGVGKSTLVAAVGELLANADIGPPMSRDNRIVGSKTNALVFIEDEELRLAIEDDASKERTPMGIPFPGEFRWLDPSALSLHCIRQIQGDQNFADLLEPVTPTVLGDDELGVVSYLVGKEYAECAIYEIGEYGGLDAFPYFRVNSAGVTYGTESMGRGELSLFLCYWFLREIPKLSILILEEPETHVSPRSQDHLMNIIAKFCEERAVWVIVTTHSPAIIRRIPQENLRLIARANGPSSVVPNASAVQISTILGGGVAYKGALLVEDAGARWFLMALLEELAPDLLPQYEVAVAGDQAKISQLIQAMPMSGDWLTLVGVYDGGLEGTVTIESQKSAEGGGRAYLSINKTSLEVASMPAHKPG